MAKTKYGYVETSDLKAIVAGHIFNVVDTAKIMENGMVVALGDEVAGEVELVKADAPAKAGTGLVLVANPAVIYDQSTTEGQSEYYYCIEAGTPARAYELCVGDRYTVSANLVDALATDVVVGNYIVVDDTASADTRKYKEVVKADLTGYGFAAKIVEVKKQNNITKILVKVTAN